MRTATYWFGGNPADSSLLIGRGTNVTVSDGTIVGVEPDTAPTDGGLAFADGLAAAPFVDVHAHVGVGVSKYGVERPDRPLALLSQGDAGPNNIERIRRRAPDGTRFAISLAGDGEEATAPCYESSPPDPEGVVRVVRDFEEDIWGISVNLDPGALGSTSPDAVFSESLNVAEELGLPLVIGTGSIWKTDVAAHIEALRPGDVITYLFRGGDSGLFERPDTIEAMRRASQRGVKLDASHGAYSFDPAVAQRAINLGLAPDTLSSDRSTFCREEMASIQHIAVGKAVAAGMSINDALSACTTRPGFILGLDVVPPAVGQPADFDIVEMTPLMGHETGDLGDPPKVQLLATVRAGKASAYPGTRTRGPV
jgi:dihydroorotase